MMTLVGRQTLPLVTNTPAGRAEFVKMKPWPAPAPVTRRYISRQLRKQQVRPDGSIRVSNRLIKRAELIVGCCTPLHYEKKHPSPTQETSLHSLNKSISRSVYQPISNVPLSAHKPASNWMRLRHVARR